MSAYDLDLHGWAHQQADALRRRSSNEIQTSRLRASRETESPDLLFPEQPPFTLEDALGDSFWPDAITPEQ